jgi:hypothetical protein
VQDHWERGLFQQLHQCWLGSGEHGSYLKKKPMWEPLDLIYSPTEKKKERREGRKKGRKGEREGGKC